MKITGIILVLLTFMFSFSLAAQNYNIADIEDSFETFSDETAKALPMMGGMGLNWNDAYMGKFPHFGAGLTVGAVFIPSGAFEDVYDLTGDDSLKDLTALGVPMPMYSVEGRIGIPILPMDAGVKIGVLNSSMLKIDDVSVGYTMFGGDVRWAILEKERGPLPELSVGIGYTYLSGEVIAPVSDQTINVSSTGAGTNLTISDTDMLFDWTANVVDFKVQASKKILLLNLSAGLGYSYGFTSAGGGITNGTVSLDGNTLGKTEIEQIEDATGITVDKEGILIDSDSNGGALRVFGGAGLNLLIFKLDFGLNYAIPAQTLGLSTNVRIQY